MPVLLYTYFQDSASALDGLECAVGHYMYQLHDAIQGAPLVTLLPIEPPVLLVSI